MCVKNLVIAAGFLVSSYHAKAWQFNAEVDVHTTTEYHDCQSYADAIVELCRLFLSTDKESDKYFIREQVVDIRKHLKKCEKSNGKRKNSTTVKVGGSHQF